MIKRLLKKGFYKLGYEIKNIRKENSALTMNAALARCKRRGVQVGTVIDIGASDGRWTLDCMRFFPEAHYLMIEAQEPHRVALDQLARKRPNADYVLAAAGRAEGKIYFDNSTLFGGLASERPFETNSIEVPVVTIDNEVKKRSLNGPYLIKLDTHGFEIPILEGASECLKNASLVIIESYNYKLTENSLRYFEICEYMKERGFLSIEMVDFLLRKRDLSFWQMDVFFIPTSSKEFTCNTFE